jgi:hypothetical protein
MYQQIIKDCTFKTFLLRLRGKMETYQVIADEFLFCFVSNFYFVLSE